MHDYRLAAAGSRFCTRAKNFEFHDPRHVLGERRCYRPELG